MPKRIYNGSYAEVEVLLPDGSTMVAVRGGEPIDVPAELAAQLDEQGDTWQAPRAEVSTTTAVSGKE